MPLRARVDNATIALVLAVVVVAVTVLTRRRVAGLLSAVSAAAVFDLLFTLPYGSFRINSTRDVQTDVALLVLGVLAGEVAHAIQRRIEDLRTSRHRFSFITSLSNLAADGEPVDFLAMSTAAELTTLLDLRDCSFTTDAAVAAPLASLDAAGHRAVGPADLGHRVLGPARQGRGHPGAPPWRLPRLPGHAPHARRVGDPRVAGGGGGLRRAARGRHPAPPGRLTPTHPFRG